MVYLWHGKISLCSVDLKKRAYIKKQTVHLHLAGQKHDEIVEALGILYDAVSRIVRAFKSNGKIPKEKTKDLSREKIWIPVTVSDFPECRPSGKARPGVLAGRGLRLPFGKEGE